MNDVREQMSNEEKQLLVDARYELRELERKEKVPDTEYLRMLENVRATGDEEQLQQFLDWHVSMSEYETSKANNEQWIKEINEKYGITEERELEELRVNALRLRPRLELLQSYHRRNGRNVMMNVNVSALSDEEVIRLYDSVTFGLESEEVNRILSEEVRNRVINGVVETENNTLDVAKNENNTLDNVDRVVMERVDSELLAKIPADEQQLYITAKYELRELERKEKVPDTEYLRMLENVRATGDEEQLQQFLDWHISMSEYETSRANNKQWIKEVNEKYGITEERELQELHIESLRLRPQLLRLKDYYEKTGSNVMRGLDVSALSDEEVIREYDRVTFGVSNERLNEMLNNSVRRRVVVPIFDERISRLEERVFTYGYEIDSLDEIDEISNEAVTIADDLEQFRNMLSDAEYRNYISRLAAINDRLEELRKQLDKNTKNVGPSPVEPQVDPVGPQVDPVGPQVDPVGPQVDPVGPQVDPVGPQVDPVGPQVDPVGPQVDPVGPQVDPVGPQVDPVGPQVDPVGPQVDPVGPQVDPVGPAEDIEKLIAEFRKGAEEIKKLFDETQFKLVLGDLNDLDVSDEIKTLDSGLKELHETAKNLIAEMDAFRLHTEDAEFSMSVQEIKSTIEAFKTRLKELKQRQIDKYNACVDEVNVNIREAKATLDIEGLEEIPRCDVEITSWTDFKYLEMLDYDRLIDAVRKISGKIVVPTETVDLEADISSLENDVKKIEPMITDDMEPKDVKKVTDLIANLSTRCNEFEVKLNNNKESLSEEDFNKYSERLKAVRTKLEELKAKLVIKESEFETLRAELQILEKEVNSFSYLVDSLYGKITIDGLKALEDGLITFEQRLELIKNKIEEKRGFLDDNQYNQLMKKVNELEEKLNKVKNKMKEPGMVVNIDVFDYLNGRIDGLEKAIEALETQITSLEAPIKDRKVRKVIDKQIKEIEEEIKFLEGQLEKTKDKDPEKYEASKNRLNELTERFNKISKVYRKKCPLMVRAVKSAVNFFKKHKKLCLIIAGLAAVALVHATVGPVIIPAIMHGNLMIAHTAPALSSFTNFVNNILGGLIRAKYNKGIWLLANGTRLSYGGATASLLKGLAISGPAYLAAGGGVIAGLVVGIKKLAEKMKGKELKLKLTQEEKEKKKQEKEKRNQEKDEKKKKESGKNKVKKADRDTATMIANLVRDFRSSGKSIDEFCMEKKLSEADKMIIQYYIDQSKNNIENNTGKRGR